MNGPLHKNKMLIALDSKLILQSVTSPIATAYSIDDEEEDALWACIWGQRNFVKVKTEENRFVCFIAIIDQNHYFLNFFFRFCGNEIKFLLIALIS